MKKEYAVVGFDWSGLFKEEEYEIQYQCFDFSIKKEVCLGNGTCFSNQIIINTEADEIQTAHEAALLFLSEMAWLFSVAILETEHGGGSTPIKCNTRFVGRKSSRLIVDFKLYKELHLNSDQALAVMYYNEAISSNNIFFSFLSLFKILEIKLTKDERKQMLGNYFSDHPVAVGHSVPEEPDDLQKYLFESCRCAIAHANRKPRIRPNDFNDIQRIDISRGVLKNAVEHYMVSGLNISRKII